MPPAFSDHIIPVQLGGSLAGCIQDLFIFAARSTTSRRHLMQFLPRSRFFDLLFNLGAQGG